MGRRRWADQPHDGGDTALSLAVLAAHIVIARMSGHELARHLHSPFALAICTGHRDGPLNFARVSAPSNRPRSR